MVFRGQDAWRKHPLVYGNWKKPFPGFGTAVVIFTGYLIIETFVTYINAPPPDNRPKKSKFNFTLKEGIDKIPEVASKSSHH